MFLNAEAYEKVSEKLAEIGVCWRCCLRYAGESGPSRYRKSEPERMDGVKKMKMTYCVVCLGLLQDMADENIISQISDKVIDEGWRHCPVVSCKLSIPACLIIRHRSAWEYLVAEFPDYFNKKDASDVTDLKKVWKWLVSSRIAAALSCKIKDNGGLEVHVDFTYTADQEECKVVCRMSKNKNKSKLLTRTLVMSEMNERSQKSLSKILKVPPDVPEVGLYVNSITCSYDTLYVAGRYQKFSRTLPQTPWIVGGVRKLPHSVDELICNVIKEALKADQTVFSSSGREDVDVRNIGNGRPFICECINSRVINLNQADITRIQQKINQGTNDISVRDLQFVSKEEIGALKVGEESKTKSYTALCRVERKLTEDELLKLTATDLAIKQKTPVRVLHRRPLADRDRMVFSMKASFIEPNNDSTLFKLYVNTQAGTYIKEFVHGDFGRTRPSLKNMLNCDVDIIALDVTDVVVDWPKRIEDIGS